MNYRNTVSFFEEWRKSYYLHKRNFTSGEASYIDALLPEIAVQLNIFEVIELLQKRLGGETLARAFNPDQRLVSPVVHQKSGDWLKKSNIVGVNVRTVGNFFNVVKYLLTLPSFHDSIHLLPVWEPGVVGSLYGKTSFNVNPEFFSQEWANVIPALNTPEKQLKALVNVAHALGKTVGMDVIPHTDRFSEMVFTHPRNFEWVKRDGGNIVSHAADLHQEVEEIIWQFINRRGTADFSPIMYTKEIFFDPDNYILSDKQRADVLFGPAAYYENRLYRRLDLMNELTARSLETLPMTMAPPYRGLHIDENSFTYDENGNKWYDYKFDQPQAMSRVFGPLTRYKFFHTKGDSWELDFENPNQSAWRFVAEKYAEMQRDFGFDFMRGDMAHVQPRPFGVPTADIKFYDPLRFIKNYVQREGVPYFAFYAETFLAPPDVMGYGDEIAHLEKIEADATLGDLQSTVVGSQEFLTKFNTYLDITENNAFVPTLTVLTADKDDPRFDEFFRRGNILRYFLSVFFNGMPGYYSLGFETRNQNLTRNKNETYSKLYVFNINDDRETDKVTHGKFEWGRNEKQFGEILSIRKIGEEIYPKIKDNKPFILKRPDAENLLFIWTQYPDLNYVFVVNFEQEKEIDESYLQPILKKYATKLLETFKQDGCFECRIYQIL